MLLYLPYVILKICWDDCHFKQMHKTSNRKLHYIFTYNFSTKKKKRKKKSWIDGIAHQVWEQSIHVPIHKQGKPRYHSRSYQPIALTPFVGKLMERTVLNRLVYCREKTHIIPVNQAGFVKVDQE